MIANGKTIVIKSKTPIPGRAAKKELPRIPKAINVNGQGFKISEIPINRASIMDHFGGPTSM